MPPLRLVLAILAGVLLAQPTLRRREQEAADIGETIATYMVERDQQAAERATEALALARSNRRWAVIAGCAAMVSIVATIVVSFL